MGSARKNNDEQAASEARAIKPHQIKNNGNVTPTLTHVKVYTIHYTHTHTHTHATISTYILSKCARTHMDIYAQPTHIEN